MKYVVFSDTHGDISAAKDVLDNLKNEIDGVIHLGDLDNDALNLEKRFKELIFYYIKGNNEFRSVSPDERVISLGGYNIFLTHGHKYKVYFGPLRLLYAAQERQAHAVLFGHTHSPISMVDGGILLFNPGSISYPRSGKYGTFGVLEIAEGKFPRGEIYEYIAEGVFRPKTF